MRAANSVRGGSSTKTRHWPAGRPDGELPLQAADGLAGLLEDLDRPDQSPRVVGVQAAGGLRVHLGQAAVQPDAAVLAGLLVRAAPQFPIGRRSLENPPQQGLQVKRRPAHEQHRPLPAADVGRRPARRVEVLRHAALLFRRQHVQQVVRHGGTLGGRRLGGADVHAAVQRHRVHGNDLGADPPRQLDADRRLARGRRAGQKPTIGCKIHAFLRPRATVITRHHRPVRVEQQLVRIGRVAIGQGNHRQVGELSRFEGTRLVPIAQRRGRPAGAQL